MEETLLIITEKDLLAMSGDQGTVWKYIEYVASIVKIRYGFEFKFQPSDYLRLKERAKDYYVRLAGSHQDQFFLQRVWLNALAENHVHRGGGMVHLRFPHIDDHIRAEWHRPLPTGGDEPPPTT